MSEDSDVRIQCFEDTKSHTELERELGRRRRRWEDDIKEAVSCEHGNEPSGYAKWWEFFG
jgi:hypothetical protein